MTEPRSGRKNDVGRGRVRNEIVEISKLSPVRKPGCEDPRRDIHQINTDPMSEGRRESVDFIEPSDGINHVPPSHNPYRCHGGLLSQPPLETPWRPWVGKKASSQFDDSDNTMRLTIHRSIFDWHGRSVSASVRLPSPGLFGCVPTCQKMDEWRIQLPWLAKRTSGRSLPVRATHRSPRSETCEARQDAVK